MASKNVIPLEQYDLEQYLQQELQDYQPASGILDLSRQTKLWYNQDPRIFSRAAESNKVNLENIIPNHLPLLRRDRLAIADHGCGDGRKGIAIYRALEAQGLLYLIDNNRKMLEELAIPNAKQERIPPYHILANLITSRQIFREIKDKTLRFHLFLGQTIGNPLHPEDFIEGIASSMREEEYLLVEWFNKRKKDYESSEDKDFMIGYLTSLGIHPFYLAKNYTLDYFVDDQTEKGWILVGFITHKKYTHRPTGITIKEGTKIIAGRSRQFQPSEVIKKMEESGLETQILKEWKETHYEHGGERPGRWTETHREKWIKDGKYTYALFQNRRKERARRKKFISVISIASLGLVLGTALPAYTKKEVSGISLDIPQNEVIERLGQSLSEEGYKFEENSIVFKEEGCVRQQFVPRGDRDIKTCKQEKIQRKVDLTSIEEVKVSYQSFLPDWIYNPTVEIKKQGGSVTLKFKNSINAVGISNLVTTFYQLLEKRAGEFQQEQSPIGKAFREIARCSNNLEVYLRSTNFIEILTQKEITILAPATLDSVAKLACDSKNDDIVLAYLDWLRNAKELQDALVTLERGLDRTIPFQCGHLSSLLATISQNQNTNIRNLASDTMYWCALTFDSHPLTLKETGQVLFFTNPCCIDFYGPLKEALTTFQPKTLESILGTISLVNHEPHRYQKPEPLHQDYFQTGDILKTLLLLTKGIRETGWFAELQQLEYEALLTSSFQRHMELYDADELRTLLRELRALKPEPPYAGDELLWVRKVLGFSYMLEHYPCLMEEYREVADNSEKRATLRFRIFNAYFTLDYPTPKVHPSGLLQKNGLCTTIFKDSTPQP